MVVSLMLLWCSVLCRAVVNNLARSGLLKPDDVRAVFLLQTVAVIEYAADCLGLVLLCQHFR